MEQELIPVDLVALVEDQVSASPIVVLHDRAGNRLLPIWIGDSEARAIAMALDRITTPRPLTHTLLLHVLQELHAKLLRVVIDRFKGQTYYATLVLETHSGPVALDARPSDALALGLLAEVPIFVSRPVMEKAGQKNPFPDVILPQQEKRELQPEEAEQLKKLLEKAREREKHSGE